MRTARSNTAFSLMEILVSMAIFTIGMVAIASIFPVATLYQRRAVADVFSQQVAYNAEAMLMGRRLSIDGTSGMDMQAASDTFVHPLLSLSTLSFTWTFNDRSYPSTITDNQQRDIYWVPLYQRTTYNAAAALPVYKTPALDWRIFVFVMDRNNSSYDVGGFTSFSNNANFNDSSLVPHVISEPYTSWTSFTLTVDGEMIDYYKFSMDNSQYSATSSGEADQIRIGDQFLDHNGNIHTAVDADPNSVTVVDYFAPRTPDSTGTFWYARPAGANKTSPTRRILILSNAVK